HRARAGWVHGHLRRLAEQIPGRPLHVLSFACGPERVLREHVAAGNDCAITLADADGRALKYAAGKLEAIRARSGVSSEVRSVEISAFRLIRDPSSVEVLRGGPDGAGYDAVLVLGLLDYLKDAQCSRFLDVLATTLRPGGICLLTNLHRVNRWRSLME